MDQLPTARSGNQFQSLQSNSQLQFISNPTLKTIKMAAAFVRLVVLDIKELQNAMKNYTSFGFKRMLRQGSKPGSFRISFVLFLKCSPYDYFVTTSPSFGFTLTSTETAIKLRRIFRNYNLEIALTAHFMPQLDMSQLLGTFSAH